MSNDLLTRSDVRELTQETSTILTEAQSFKIATNVSYQLAAEELKRIKGAAKRLETLRKSITQPMDTAKSAVLDFFRQPAEQLEQAETQIKSAMGAYKAELDRQEDERRKEAEKAAEEERERLAAAAAVAAQEGRRDDAEEIAAQVATVVTAPVLARQAPKIAGINFRSVPKFEITDASLLPRMYLIPDEIKIRKAVTALGLDANIPGVRVWMADQIAAGAA